VQADPDRLKQITLNLLSNAAKFTTAPGRVWVECVDHGPAVAIRVRDTGRGIPAESLGRIFEPFVQVDQRADSKNQKGVGLGLAISRELARLMGGDVSVESEVDKPGASSTEQIAQPIGDATYRERALRRRLSKNRRRAGHLAQRFQMAVTAD
jgi:signal transduction histidine kinase